MKRLVLATALIAVSGFSAFAQEAPMMLSSAITSKIMAAVPGIDLSGLTGSQYDRLENLFSNADDLRPGHDLSGSIKAIVNAQ